jgi:hypothetical protein
MHSCPSQTHQRHHAFSCKIKRRHQHQHKQQPQPSPTFLQQYYSLQCQLPNCNQQHPALTSTPKANSNPATTTTHSLDKAATEFCRRHTTTPLPAAQIKPSTSRVNTYTNSNSKSTATTTIANSLDKATTDFNHCGQYSPVAGCQTATSNILHQHQQQPQPPPNSLNKYGVLQLTLHSTL